jgi:hypothetical protein
LKFLLDEMYPAAIAEALRDRGHDVVAVQEDRQLRSLDDPSLFAKAQEMGCSIVTENINDFVALDAAARARGRAHYGLVFTSPKSFPRARRRFVGAMVRALAAFMGEHDETEPSGGIWWLEPTDR